MKNLLATIILFILSLHFSESCAWAANKKASPQQKAPPAEIIVDTVIASVNGRPITLRQLSARLRPPRQLALTQAASDQEARYMLDVLILEEVIQDETAARKISLTDAEVDRYVEEVAARNSLSREGFEQALQREGRKLDDYRNQVKVEILKSKLSSSVMQAGAGVTSAEIKKYLEDHPELVKSGSKVKLSQIFTGFNGKTFEQAREIIEQAKKRLGAGEDFAAVAKEFSESPEGKEGGSLGVMAEEDLNPVMFDAVFSLKKGQVSDIVTSDSGFHIFKLEKRLKKKGGSSSKVEDEVRTILEREKLASRMQDYFTSEIYKKHAVDKKI